MGVFDRVRAMLGLGDEEYYDDEYDEYDETEEYQDDTGYTSPYAEDSSAVHRLERRPDVERARQVAADRAAAPQVQMHVVEPRSYSEAQGIADRFKAGVPIIMNLTVTDHDLSKRLLDFASGLTYGLDGGLNKVSEKVFMLTPANVEVSAEARRRLKDKGLFSIDI